MKVDTLGLGVESAIRDARKASAVGADCVWFAEMGGDALDAVLVAATTRPDVELGTAVAGALVRNPMECAYRIAGIQRLAGAPIRFGIGSQARQVIRHQYGLRWDRALDKLVEFRCALLEIWDAWSRHASPTFRGAHFKHLYTPPPLIPADVGHPPEVLLGATQPFARAVAAKHFDGLIVHPCTPLGFLREVVAPEFRAACDSRLPRPELVCQTIMICVNEERSRARAFDEMRHRIWYWAAAGVHQAAFNHVGLDDVTRVASSAVRRGDASRMPDVITDEVVEQFCFVGTGDEVVATIRSELAGVVDRVVTAFGDEIPLNDARGIVERIRA